MKPNEGVLTSKRFKLHPQNTIDGHEVLKEPTFDTQPNTLFVVTPCMGTLMLSYV